MLFDFLALAENAANDSRGALTLVGLNQRVIAPLSLPFDFNQRLVIGVSDELKNSSGSEFGQVPDGVISIKVLDPSGDAVFVTNEEVKLPGEKRWLDLPLLANVVVDLNFRCNTYGIYVIEITHTPSDSEEQMRRFPVYIVSHQVALNRDKEPGRAFQFDADEYISPLPT